MKPENQKFGIGVGLGFPEPIGEQIALIAKVGFDACFTGWSDGCEIGKWAEIIAQNGLIYQSVHAPFNKVDKLWEEGSAGEEYTDLLIRCLDDCAKYKVPIMVAHVIIGMDKHSPSELGLTRFARLMAAAEEKKVIVAFENTEGIEYLQAVMDRFGSSPYCGFCFDTGHEMCYNYSQDVLSRFGSHLVATHINDNRGMADTHVMTWLDDAHLIPFDGLADWFSVMARIDKTGYTGIYTLELTKNNKPGKHTHDAYAAWSCEQFLTVALERAKKVAALR